MRAVAGVFATCLFLVAALMGVGAFLAGGLSPGCAAECFGWRGLALALLAFFCEYVDSTLGMGYGTALTPLLMLLFGLEPLVVVPCVLLSELATGLSAAAAHHVAGNVSFTRRARATRVAAVLAGCSVFGAAAAVVVVLHIPGSWLKLFIGLLVFTMGLLILAAPKQGYRFSWGRITVLGMVAAFNKGASGGGYGPIVTGGQILSGIEDKSAIGITSLAEGLTCVVGLAAYLVAGRTVAWAIALPMIIGALSSVPVSALTVSRVRALQLRKLVGVTTLFLGALTLIRLL